MVNPKNFHLFSGGAKGADLYWDAIAQQYGIENRTHFRPEDYKTATRVTQFKIKVAVSDAAIALGRPMDFKGIELVYRNWFQVASAEAIYAIGYIIAPDNKDDRGFTNKTDHEIVSGGTGWTVQMAIDREKPVYVFDQQRNYWCTWGDNGVFLPTPEPPKLMYNFAGIGTRDLQENGKKAIRDVFKKTFR